MGVHSLGYLRLESAAIDQWRTFGREVLGLMPVEGADPDTLYFRMDDHPYRLSVAPGAAAAVRSVGFEVLGARGLADLVNALENAGVKVAAGSEDEAAERRVAELVKFNDPAGVPLEAFHTPVFDYEPVQTPLVSGFVTGNMGMGHVVLGAPDIGASVDFYCDVLGFRIRNTMKVPLPADMPPLSFYFLGCNARHHTLGLFAQAPPGSLVHFMVEAASVDDVGRALDRCAATGAPVRMTLGRHTNDEMLSFYAGTPDGAMVEFGCEGLHVEDDDAYPTFEMTRGSYWGHQYQA